MRLAALIFCCTLLPLHVSANGTERTFDETVEFVIESLDARGFIPDFMLDHAANAASVELELRPTKVIFFVQDRTQRRLLRRSPTIAIDLPLKVAVFEDEDGQVHVTYNQPGYLWDRHGLRSFDTDFRDIDRIFTPLAEIDNGLVTIVGQASVQTTVDAIVAAINGVDGMPFRIPRIYDFGTRTRGPAQLIVFGNPRAGTPLMQSKQNIALDLPQKMLVWADRDDVTHITYNDPFFIAKRHGIENFETLLSNIAAALANFANAGANASEVE